VLPAVNLRVADCTCFQLFALYFRKWTTTSWLAYEEVCHFVAEERPSVCLG